MYQNKAQFSGAFAPVTTLAPVPMRPPTQPLQPASRPPPHNHGQRPPTTIARPPASRAPTDILFWMTSMPPKPSSATVPTFTASRPAPSTTPCDTTQHSTARRGSVSSVAAGQHESRQRGAGPARGLTNRLFTLLCTAHQETLHPASPGRPRTHLEHSVSACHLVPRL